MSMMLQMSASDSYETRNSMGQLRRRTRSHQLGDSRLTLSFFTFELVVAQHENFRAASLYKKVHI